MVKVTIGRVEVRANFSAPINGSAPIRCSSHDVVARGLSQIAKPRRAMSTFLAIGAVSAVLHGLIEASLGRNDLATVLGATPDVSALPPDRIQTGQGTPDRINLFLFQATENAAWRNMDFPSRNGHGDRLTNPKLALDLHYLVTAYGSTDFHAEVLLGHAMFVLHETPVLTRQAIRDALAALTPSGLAGALAASRLADQFEQIKIVPRYLNVEEVSKIWTALQSQYRTTAAYHVSWCWWKRRSPRARHCRS